MTVSFSVPGFTALAIWGFIVTDHGSGNLLDTITISGTNPYNPFGFDLIPNGDPGGNYNSIRRRVIEAGPPAQVKARSRLVEPTLEDAYLLMLGPDAHRVHSST